MSKFGRTKDRGVTLGRGRGGLGSPARKVVLDDSDDLGTNIPITQSFGVPLRCFPDVLVIWETLMTRESEPTPASPMLWWA